MYFCGVPPQVVFIQGMQRFLPLQIFVQGNLDSVSGVNKVSHQWPWFNPCPTLLEIFFDKLESIIPKHHPFIIIIHGFFRFAAHQFPCLKVAGSSKATFGPISDLSSSFLKDLEGDNFDQNNKEAQFLEMTC